MYTKEQDKNLKISQIHHKRKERDGIRIFGRIIALAILVAGLSIVTGSAANNQLVLLDTTYTHDTAVVNYPESGSGKAFSFFNLPTGIPGNLISPIDYAHGTLYQRLQVLSKPSGKTVKYQLCIFQDKIVPEEHACSNEGLLTFTGTGTYYANQQMTSLFQYGNLDWSRSLRREMLVVKDRNGKPVDDRYGWLGTWDGSPNFALYYPMKVRYTAIIVPPGGGAPTWPDGGGSTPTPSPTSTPAPSSTPIPTPIPTSSPLPTTNLAPNPSFEIVGNSPQSWLTNVWGGSLSKISFAWTSDYKYDGSKSVKIVSTDPYGKARWLTGRDILVTPGSKYTFDTNVKTNNVGKAYMCVTFWTSGLGYISLSCTGSKSGTNDWSVLRSSTIVPSGTKYARIELRAEGTGTTWYDVVSLKKI